MLKLQKGLSIALAMTLFGVAGCGDDETTEDQPRILSFAVSPATVAIGESATLEYEAENASTIDIVADPGGEVLAPTSDQSGSVAVGPFSEAGTVSYTIRASKGETLVSETRTLTITSADEDVRIVAFSADPLSVELGAQSTLSWETENATSVAIATSDGDVVLAASPQFSGTLEVSPTPPATTYVLTAEGPNGPASNTITVSVQGAPAIADFSAAPNPISEGESTTLSWATTNIDSITITDDAGNTVATSANATGTASVAPSTTTVYTLSADRASFPSDTQTLTVTVNPLQGAQIVSFTASPEILATIGDSSVLAWEVQNAGGGIEIFANGTTSTSSSDLSGTYTVTPTVSTTYELYAYDAAGDAGPSSVSVTVNPSAPAISLFQAQPSDVMVGGDTTLGWQTLGAAEVRVVLDANTIFTDTGNLVDVGTFDTTITSTGAHVFTLEAENSTDVNRSSATVRGWEVPSIDTFVVDPLTYMGASTTATITYSVTQTSEVELYVDGTSVGTSTTPDGRWNLTINGTQSVELVARNPVSESRQSLTVAVVVGENEPNDDSTTAVSLPGDGSGAMAEINPAGDVDWYAITVPAGGSLTVFTGDGQGGCDTDTEIFLYDVDGTTELGSDDDDGAGTCSEINPSRDAFARNLPAGTYFVQVEEFGNNGTGPYFIFATVTPAECGNGLIETNAGEQCDDANASAGDGCSDVCAFEPVGTLPTAPGTELSAVGSLEVPSSQDVYEVTMLTDGYIFAETFVPEVGRCDTNGGAESNDTVLVLLDSSFNELGRDDNDGIDDCSKIDLFDAFAAVPAGTYYVLVQQADLDATIQPYAIEITTVGVGCGNGILETGETCDDGNSFANDGCSATCQFEGTVETEPNDDFATATPFNVVPGTPFIGSGVLSSAEEDWFQVTVPEGHHIDAFVTVGSLSACPNTISARVTLYDTNGTTIIANDDNDGPNGTCGRVWPYNDSSTLSMTAGTYYLRVTEDNDVALPVYYLHINVHAPGCGNTIIEGAEQCEDGNLVSGDGCSSTCGYEPLVTYAVPGGGRQTFTESMVPGYNQDVVALDVTQPSYIRAEVFAPSVASQSCVDSDPELVMFDSNWNELGRDDSLGVGNCPLIRPESDAFATVTTTGTYYLVLQDDPDISGVREIPAYQILVEPAPLDVCGNGYLEATNSEQCDDGNTVSGDGCDASCFIEPDAIISGPGAPPLGTVQVVSGAFPVETDVDWYRLEVTSPAWLRVETGVPTLGLCSPPSGTTANFDFILFSNDLTTELGDYSATTCPVLDNSTADWTFLPVGTYMLYSSEFGQNGIVDAYEFEISLIPPDVCGNGIAEAGELCDDRNNVDGDGCSATCQLEPIFTYTADGVTTATVTAQAIIPSTQVNAYQIDVPQASGAVHISIETFVDSVAGTCSGTDTEIRLYNDQGVELGSDDFDGVLSCSLINRTRDAFAVLAPGTYFLTVEEDGQNSEIPQYEIVFSSTPGGVCGDALTDFPVGESCDDGNTVGGDGCNNRCETEWVYNGPAGPTTFTGSIDPATVRPTVEVNLSSDAYLRAETFTDSVAGTCSNDTIARLYDANGVELGSDDDDGVSLCSLFDGIDDGFALVPAGTYYISVEEFGQNSVIPTFDIVVEAREANVCGNGLDEAGGGETCDDGNTTSGDGCDSSCQVETVIGPPGTQTYSGSIIPDTDLDTIPIVATTDAYVFVETGAPALGQCDPDLVTSDDFEMELRSDLGAVIASVGDNNCPTLGPVAVTAGTYELDVGEYFNSAIIESYGVRVTVSPQNVCGNWVEETGETCDDGNATGGDGCDASCQVETLVGPGANVSGVSQTYRGGFETNTDEDTFPFQLTADGYLSVVSGVPAIGRCDNSGESDDFDYEVRDSLGAVVASDSGFSCNELDPVALAAGDYTLAVTENGTNDTLPIYELELSLLPADVCGNTILEAPEECDDGNSVSGDGCSDQCLVEPLGTYTADGSVVTFTGQAIAQPTEIDRYTLRVPAGGDMMVRIATYDDANAFTCSDDTRVRLIDANTSTELGNDDLDGPGSCSLIDGRVDSWAVLAPGDYIVSVEEDGQSTTIANYDILFESFAVGACGNTVVEAGEQCDDGNTAAGDGCSATCQFDATPVLSGVGSVTVPGSFLPVGQENLYIVNVTTVPVTMSVESGIFNPDSCIADMVPGDTTNFELEVLDAVSTSLGSIESSGCPDLTGVQITVPGLYTVRAGEWNLNSILGRHSLRITVQ